MNKLALECLLLLLVGTLTATPFYFGVTAPSESNSTNVTVQVSIGGGDGNYSCGYSYNSINYVYWIGPIADVVNTAFPNCTSGEYYIILASNNTTNVTAWGNDGAGNSSSEVIPIFVMFPPTGIAITNYSDVNATNAFGITLAGTCSENNSMVFLNVSDQNNGVVTASTQCVNDIWGYKNLNVLSLGDGTLIATAFQIDSIGGIGGGNVSIHKNTYVAPDSYGNYDYNGGSVYPNITAANNTTVAGNMSVNAVTPNETRAAPVVSAPAHVAPIRANPPNLSVLAVNQTGPIAPITEMPFGNVFMYIGMMAAALICIGFVIRGLQFLNDKFFRKKGLEGI